MHAPYTDRKHGITVPTDCQHLLAVLWCDNTYPYTDCKVTVRMFRTAAHNEECLGKHLERRCTFFHLILVPLKETIWKLIQFELFRALSWIFFLGTEILSPEFTSCFLLSENPNWLKQHFSPPKTIGVKFCDVTKVCGDNLLIKNSNF